MEEIKTPGGPQLTKRSQLEAELDNQTKMLDMAKTMFPDLVFMADKIQPKSKNNTPVRTLSVPKSQTHWLKQSSDMWL